MYEYYCTGCGNMFSTIMGCKCPYCASEETVSGCCDESMTQEEIDEEVEKINNHRKMKKKFEMPTTKEGYWKVPYSKIWRRTIFSRYENGHLIEYLPTQFGELYFEIPKSPYGDDGWDSVELRRWWGE